MSGQEWLAARFEEERPRLRAVARRLLGATGEADDAVQEAWLRASRAGADGVENLGGWLTTIVARVCLNQLQARRVRREESLDLRPSEPRVAGGEEANPEDAAILGDAVGLALLIVLEALTPAERVAFVLHDVFAVPFDQIAPIVGRSPEATRQLASRARRRVRGAQTSADADLAGQRRLIDAFLAAARGGDLVGLLAVLDPAVVLRSDRDAATAGGVRVVHGARAVAEGAQLFAAAARDARPAFVNGKPGIVAWDREGRPFSVLGFTVIGERIVAIDAITDLARLARLDLRAFEAGAG